MQTVSCEDCGGSGQTMMDRFRNLCCFWRARCVDCGNRRPEFVDGRCFHCTYARIEKRSWQDIGQAICAAIKSSGASNAQDKGTR
jgi:hypothetical protein